MQNLVASSPSSSHLEEHACGPVSALLEEGLRAQPRIHRVAPVKGHATTKTNNLLFDRDMRSVWEWQAWRPGRHVPVFGAWGKAVSDSTGLARRRCIRLGAGRAAARVIAIEIYSLDP